MTERTTYTATEARNRFADVFDEAHYGGPVVVKKGNKAVAVIPYEMLRKFEELEAQLDRANALKAIETSKGKKGKPIAQLKHELSDG